MSAKVVGRERKGNTMSRYEIVYYQDFGYKITIEADSDQTAQKFLDYLLDGAIEPEDADRAETLFAGITYGNCSAERFDSGLVDFDSRLEVVS